ncbi:MAG: hypothetical protein C4541_10255 [Candidatus Auribacter fodinae]|jgi:hypothetical protein|uniref:Uncharacterized protein n=1 Tax=Candidatus Auribacter fodinae TaxID=2093366 RepID=A0A3A4QYC6_9BACT|nr:MAG: hypothetical protein C4541_10255 [Candidatus Auribacter fodinae]
MQGFSQEDVDRMIQEAAAAARQKSGATLDYINGKNSDEAVGEAIGTPAKGVKPAPAKDVKPASAKETKAAPAPAPAAKKADASKAEAPAPEDLADEIMQQMQEKAQSVNDGISDEDISDMIGSKVADSADPAVKDDDFDTAFDLADFASDDAAGEITGDVADIAVQEEEAVVPEPEGFDADQFDPEPETETQPEASMDDTPFSDEDFSVPPAGVEQNISEETINPFEYDEAVPVQDEVMDTKPLAQNPSRRAQSVNPAQADDLQSFIMSTIEELAQAKMELAEVKIALEIEKLKNKAKSLFV